MVFRPFFIISILALLLSQTVFSQTVWTSPHGPGLRGLSPARTTAQPALRWKLLMPQGIGHGGVSFGSGGRFLYFKTYGPYQSRVCKVDSQTGKLLWTTADVFGFRNLSGVTVDDGANRLYTQGGVTSRPENQAFVACLDSSTGRTVWKTPLLGPTGAPIDCGEGNVLLSPDRTRLYVHDGAGHVYALRSSTGAIIWSQVVPVAGGIPPFQTVGPLWVDPASGRPRLAVGANRTDVALSCVQDDGDKASVAWQASVAKGMNFRFWGHAAASLDGSRLYLNGFWDAGNAALTCLESATGAEVWRLQGKETETLSSFPPPCVGADGTIYLAGLIKARTSVGGISAIAPDGTLRWSIPTRRGEANGWPCVTANKTIYVVDEPYSGKPYLLAIRDQGGKGNLLWRVQLPNSYGGYGSAVAGPDGTVYIASVSNTSSQAYLYAFAPENEKRAVRLPSNIAPEPPVPPLAPMILGPGPNKKTVPSLADVPGSEPVLVPQIGHSEGVQVAAYSPDGLYVMTGSTDRSTILWDARTGSELRRYTGHAGPVRSLAFSPDGRTFATSSADLSVRLWDTTSGREIRRFTGHSLNVTCVAFSPDGRYLASSSDDGTVRVWDVDLETAVQILEHADALKCVAFSPDGRTLASAGDDRTVRIWNVADGRNTRTYEGHTAGILSVAFSPDGQSLASGSRDRTVRIWDLSSRNTDARRVELSDWGSWVDFSPNGRYLAIAMGDGILSVLDQGNGKEVRRFTDFANEDTTRMVYTAVFSPDGRSLLSGAGAGNVTRIWDLEKGQESIQLGGHVEALSSLALSPEGRRLAICGWDNYGRIWDLPTGKQVLRLGGYTGWVNGIAWSRDGRYVASVGWDCIARVWDVTSGLLVRTLLGHEQSVTHAAFSTDDRYLATSSYDGTVRLWEISSGHCLYMFRDTGAQLKGLAFSPNGRYLAMAADDGVATLWDIEKRTILHRMTGHTERLIGLDYSPTGELIATTSDDNSIRFWDASTGVEIAQWRAHGSIAFSIAFSDDGTRLAIGGTDGSAGIYDFREPGEPKFQRFTGHNLRVLRSMISDDGRYLFSVGEDRTTRVWDIATGQEMCKIIGFQDGSWAVVDAHGRYDASSVDIDGLVWVIGNEPVRLSQMRDYYYEPGLLGKILGQNTEPLRSVTAFAKVARPPIVSIQPPIPGSTVATFRLTDRGGGIGRVSVSVNGSEYVSDARAPNAGAEVSLDLKGAPTFRPGADNTISAVGYTAGVPSIASHPVTTVWRAPGQTETAPNRFFALIVGVSDYAGAGLRLQYAARDANDLFDVISVGAANRFGPDNLDIRLLSTARHTKAAPPTKAAIEVALIDFRKASRPGDTVLIYMAGHGVTLPQGRDTYCFLTRDAMSKQDIVNQSVGSERMMVTSNELSVWLRQVPALNRIIVLDTCEAGHAGEVLVGDLPGDQARAFTNMQVRYNTHVLMGCGRNASSYGHAAYGRGFLTYALLDGMRGAALREGGVLETDTLFGYVVTTVPRLASSLAKVQIPEYRAQAGQSVELGLLRSEDRARIPQAVERPVVVRPVFENIETSADDLELGPRLRARLDERERACVNRTQSEPCVAWVDADDLPGALVPRGTYAVDGQRVLLRLEVWRDGRMLNVWDLDGSLERIDELTERVENAVVNVWQPSAPSTRPGPGEF